MNSPVVVYRQPGRHGARKAYLKPALALAFLLGSLVCGNAWAHGHFGHHHHGGAHVGLFISAPLRYGYAGPGWYGEPYGWPYYRYRYETLVPAEPPVYVERGAPSLWYFCSNPQGYYPYVQQCTTDWRAVAPQSVIR